MANKPSAVVAVICEPCTLGLTFSTMDDSLVNRVCQPISPCANGTIETKAPTLSSDRECNACTGGKYADGSQCREPTVCSEGQFELVAPTPSFDRVCENCGAGFFSDTVGSTSCKKHTECDTSSANLEFQAAVAPSRFSDRVCLPVQKCSKNEYTVAQPTATTDRVCAQCTECPETASQVCTATSDAVCASCRVCGPGQYVLKPCTLSSNTTCASCEPCAADTYEEVPCTPSSPPVCQPLKSCTKTQFEVGVGGRRGSAAC